MNVDDRRERLRVLTAEASRGSGRLPEEPTGGAPAAGDLYVLPQTAEFPLEWALLRREPGEPESWLAVPADTNPLRGPGDVWIGPGEAAGPLCLRCRFSALLSRPVLEGGRRTGRLSAGAAEEALAAWRDHERGVLQPGPLAKEVAADPEYRSWERQVLAPAREAASRGAPAAPAPVERAARRGPGRDIRPLLALAAGLGLLCVGLGAWSWTLLERVDRLSSPVLIGGSQEIVVGTDVRGPVTLRVRPSDERLLVFVVLSGESAGYEHYRVEIAGREGRVLWTSLQVERGPASELNLVIPRRFLERATESLRLRLFGVEDAHERLLAEVPVRVEQL